MLVASALAMAQIVVPSGDGLSVDQRIALLSAGASRTTSRIERVVYRDPALRAEIRRVGFVRGCDAVGVAGREVRDRHAEALRAALAAAIRGAVPARILAEARPVSFVAGPLATYGRRVEEQLERSSGPLLADLAEDMRRSFLARTAPMQATANEADNRIAPKPDIAAALGIGDHWDLDNPNQIAMACSEQRIPPHLRPTITTGVAPR
jgi:hypothetical protein